MNFVPSLIHCPCPAAPAAVIERLRPERRACEAAQCRPEHESPSLRRCPGATLRRLTAKPLWIRFNRLLAWAVVTSPFAQIALGTNLLRGLLLDLGLLLAHCALSLWLFGLPRAATGERWKLWVGLRPRGLSVRGRFLLTAWRIALGLAWIPAAFVLGKTFGYVALIFALVCLPLWLLQPFLMMGHVSGASEYAFKRWGMTGDGDAYVAAFSLTSMFAFANTINLFR